MTDRIPYQIHDVMDEWGLTYVRSITEPSKTELGYASVHIVEKDGKQMVLKDMPLDKLKVCYDRLSDLMSTYDGNSENVLLPSRLEAQVFFDPDEQDEHGEFINDEHAFLLSDYIPYQSDDLNKEGEIPIDIACRFGLDAAKGISEIHAQGYIHGDIKASNAVITKDGITSDFDLDCAMPIGSQDAEDGKLVCTLSHIAPDLIQEYLRNYESAKERDSLIAELSNMSTSSDYSSRYRARLDALYENSDDAGKDGYKITPAQDVYAFGTMMFNLIDGNHPLMGYGQGVDTLDLIDLKKKEMIRPATRYVPSDLGEIIQGCLKADPVERPTMEQTIAVFEKYAASHEDVAKHLKKQKVAKKEVRREAVTIPEGQARACTATMKYDMKDHVQHVA